MADVVRNGETSVSDLTERCQPLVGKLHPMLPENAMRLLADLDQLYSDLLDARVAGATRWEALTLLINATIPAIDDAPRRHPRPT